MHYEESECPKQIHHFHDCLFSEPLKPTKYYVLLTESLALLCRTPKNYVMLKVRLKSIHRNEGPLVCKKRSVSTFA